MNKNLTSLLLRPSTLATLFATTLAIATVACDGDDGSTGGTSDVHGECTTGARGTFKIVVNGLPEGTNADLKVTGPDGEESLTGSTTKTDAALGAYTVSAAIVTTPDPIVRTAYSATISRTSSCVAGNSETVTVAYAAIPSSNKLWITNQNATKGATLLGFSGATLAAAGSPVAAFRGTGDVGHESFDAEGNLFAPKGATITVYSASALGASTDVVALSATRTIALPELGACVPAISGTAFDVHGNLWVASPCNNAVFSFPKDGLGSGEARASAKIALNGPAGVAFDVAGNLFAAAEGKIHRYDSAALSTATPTEALAISSETSGAVVSGLGTDWLAFDKTGDLWTVDATGAVIYRISKSELAATGVQTITPSIQIKLAVTSLPESLAFDEGGGLWLSSTQGTFVRLSPTQLTASNDALTADRVITSSEVGYAAHVAFFPAPFGLPLASALR